MRRFCLPLLLLTLLFSINPLFAQGVPNVNQTKGNLIAGPFAPQQGRTAVIAYHQGWLITYPEIPSSAPVTINGVPTPLDYQIRQWDISDLSNVRELQQLGVTPHGFSAHGAIKTGDWLIFGNEQYRIDSFGGTLIEGTYSDSPLNPWTRGGLYPPYTMTTYWSYDVTSGMFEFRRDDTVLARWDHLARTGVLGHPILLGNLLYILSEQSNTGIAIYDMSVYLDGNPDNNPAEPPLIGLQTVGGFGGYWGELWGGDGQLLAVNSYRTGGNGLRVIDVTTPSTPGNMVDIAFTEYNSASMYPQFQDHFAFSGSSKVNMRTLEVDYTFPVQQVQHTIPGMGDGDGIDTSQYLLPVGNLLITGGLGGDSDIQGMAIWAHQAAPDTTGPSVGYHIPKAGQTNYPVEAPISLLIHETLETSTIINGDTFIVRPFGGSAINGTIFFGHNDVLTFQPDAPLSNNTTYEVVLRENGIQDAVGNGMESYTFTFSTGSDVGGNLPPSVESFTVTASPIQPGTQVTFNASGSDPDMDSLQFRFLFGDDSDPSPWSSATSINHTYTEEGHYRAMVQVRDPGNLLASRNLVVTVVVPPAGAAPLHSSQVVVDDSARRVYTVNPDNNSVTVVNADTHAVIREIAVSQDPRSLDLAPDGNLWVTAHDADVIDIVNPNTGSIVNQIDLDYGDSPFALLFAPDGSNAYVSLTGAGELIRINQSTRQITGRLTLGPTARALAINGDGTRLLVTRFISPSRHGEVWDINLASFSLTRTFVLPLKIQTDGTADGGGVPNYLASVTITPNNQRAWVTTVKANVTKGANFGDLSLNDPDNTVRTELIGIDLVSNQVMSDNAQRVDLDNSDSASAIAFLPLGDYLMVSNQGTNDVLILDVFRMATSQGLGSLTSRVGVGLAPQAIAVDASAEQVFVKNFMGRSLSVFNYSDLITTGNINIQATTIDTVTSETLAQSVFDGKKVFYNAGDPRMSAEGYISCASCHADGGHDGRTWDFTQRNEGFRNTMPLNGRAGTGHGNVHWTANFDEIQDFENDIRLHFGGSGFLSENHWDDTRETLGPPKAGLSQELEDMAAYLASLDASTIPRSPHRESNGDLTGDALLGSQIFIQEDCTTCHNPAQAFTDRQLRDVGTIKTPTSGNRMGETLPGLETQTLLGLWETAPYLHDGTATTLFDVFRNAGGTWYDNEAAQHLNGNPGPQFYPTQNWLWGSNSRLDRNTNYALEWQNVDGGSGGTGQLMFRYAAIFNGQDVVVSLIVNGASRNITFPSHAADESAVPYFIVDSVNLNAGASNTIRLQTNFINEQVQIDAMLVSTADDLAQAQPHRRVLGLSSNEQNQLLAYLLQLDGSDEVTQGQVERRYWTGVSGTTVNDLRNDARFPADPVGADTLTSLEALGWANSINPGGNREVGENYGQQIRGYLRAPESGDYVFYISSDDASELYLSTDEDPANIIQIAAQPSFNEFRTWNANAEQTSSNNGFTFNGGSPGVISLQAGQRYYFEVLHKEGGGGDHLAVAWTLPSQSGSPSNGDGSRIIAGDVLEPFADSFRNTLPDMPTAFAVSAFATDKIHFGFVDNANNEVSYTLDHREQGGDWTSLSLSAVSGRGHLFQQTLDGFDPATTYEFRLRANNSVGPTAWSTTQSATTFPEETARRLTYTGDTPFEFSHSLSLQQEATIENNALNLWHREDEFGTRSAIWHTDLLPAQSFTVQFEFQTSNITGTGRGEWAFVLQDQTANEASSGNDGGYAGLFPNKAGVLFVNDGTNSIVSGRLNEDSDTLWDTGGYAFDNGDRYQVTITYRGGDLDELQVAVLNLNTQAKLNDSYYMDLETLFPNGAYFGFIGRKGNSQSDFNILSWTYEARMVEDPQQLPFNGSNFAIPGTIQAEDWDLGGDGVALSDLSQKLGVLSYRPEDNTDVNDRGGGNYSIGFIATGEWLEYTADITPGVYNVHFSVMSFSGTNGSQDLALLIGTTEYGVIDVPNTSGAFVDVSLTNLNLNRGGQQRVRVAMRDSGFDLDSFTFERIGDVIAPNEPSNLVVATVDSSSLQISFTDNANDETGFTLNYRVAGETSWQEQDLPLANGSGTTVVAQLTGLLPNTTYQVRVKANGSSGDSNWSNTLSGTTENDGSVCVTPISVQAHPESDEVCAGDGVSFSVSASGDPAPSYQWRINGQNIPGATNTVLNLSNVDSNDLGTYDVVISNICGTVTSAGATLTFAADPVVITPPADTSTCETGSASFSVVASNALSYQWRHDGQNISGANSATLQLSNLSLADAGSYDVVIGGTCDDVISAVATLDVFSGPQIINQPASITACTGGEASFSINVDGPITGFQWLRDGVPISGANANTLVLTDVSVDDAASYSCEIESDCGFTETNAATLSVSNSLQITANPANTSVCSGDTFLLTVAATSSGPLNYQWFKDGQAVNGATNATLQVNSASISDAGAYHCVVTSDCGSLDSQSARITIDQGGVHPRIAGVPVGVNPPVLEAWGPCLDTPTFTWFESETQIQLGEGNPFQLPSKPNASMRVTVVAQEQGGATHEADFWVLVADDSRFDDYNNDGCNSIDDLYEYAANHWRTQDTSVDADGNGRINMLDLIYINISDGESCSK